MIQPIVGTLALLLCIPLTIAAFAFPRMALLEGGEKQILSRSSDPLARAEARLALHREVGRFTLFMGVFATGLSGAVSVAVMQALSA